MPTKEQLAVRAHALGFDTTSPYAQPDYNPDAVPVDSFPQSYVDRQAGNRGGVGQRADEVGPAAAPAPYARQDAVAPQPDQSDVQNTQTAAAGFPDPGLPQSGKDLPDAVTASTQSGSVGGQIGMDKVAGYDAGQKFSGRVDALNAQQQQVNDAATQADDEEARLTAAYNTELGRRQDKLNAEKVVAAQDYENAMKDINTRATEATRMQMSKVEAASQAALNFQFKDFFASRSTLGTVMGLLSAGIGGGVNGLQGHAGSPTALDRVIAQDWEQQKAQYAQLRDNVSDQKTLFQELMQSTDDERAAYLAFHNAVISKFNAMGDQIVSGMADQGAQVHLAQMKAINAKNQADRNSKFGQQAMQGYIAEMQQETHVALASEKLNAALVGRLAQNAESPLRGAGIEVGNYKQNDIGKVSAQVSHGFEAVQLIDTMLANRDISQDAARGERLAHLIAGASTSDGRALIAKAKSINTGFYKNETDAPEGGHSATGIIASAAGKMFGRVYNRLESDSDYKARLRELRGEVLGELQSQIRGRGGIIAPKLPDGRTNVLYNPQIDGPLWKQYVQQRMSGTLPDKPQLGGSAGTQDASYDEDM